MSGHESQPPEDSFQKKTIESEHGTVSYGHVKPEHPKSGKPVMILPGYGLSLRFTKGLAEKVAAPNENGEGRETFVLEHSRTEFDLRKEIQKLYPGAPKLALELDIVTLRRAHEAILVLEKNNTKAHLVGHSFGGMVIVAIALLRPNLVESLTLLNAGGLIGRQNPVRFFFRFIKNWVAAERKKHPGRKGIWPIIKETLFTYMRKNFVRALREEIVVATTDIGPALGYLAKQGMKITVVYDRLDQVFPSKDVEKTLGIGSDRPPTFKTIQTNGNLHYGPVLSSGEYAPLINQIVDEHEQGSAE